MVDLVERINAMLQQERNFYTCEDYLSPAFQQKLLENATGESGSDILLTDSSSSVHSSSSSRINEVWREKICEWAYQVVDHFDFSREVVNISMSFLDRYLSTRLADKKMFQLAAMTTLYLTVKLYEQGTLSMASMIELSRGYFMVEQMTVMEMSILRALNWHVHPPTAFCFARHLLHMCPPSETCPANVRHDILELARFLTELSAIDYYFVNKKSSSVGLAALMNAMDITCAVPMAFFDAIKSLDHLDFDDTSEECRLRLRDLYYSGGYSRNHDSPLGDAMNESRTETVSPVSVLTSFDSYASQHHPHPSVCENTPSDGFQVINY